MTMHEKFQLAQSRRKFARLLRLSQEQEKQLEENPRPFLDRAYDEVTKHRQLLEEIREAANGLSSAPPNEYQSIEAGLLKRLRKIQELLSAAAE